MVLRAEVEHLLGFCDSADHRAGERAAVGQQREHVQRQRLGGAADVDQDTVGGQQQQVGVQVDVGTDRVDDQVERTGRHVKGTGRRRGGRPRRWSSGAPPYGCVCRVTGSHARANIYETPTDAGQPDLANTGNDSAPNTGFGGDDTPLKTPPPNRRARKHSPPNRYRHASASSTSSSRATLRTRIASTGLSRRGRRGRRNRSPAPAVRR